MAEMKAMRISSLYGRLVKTPAESEVITTDDSGNST